MQEKDLIEQLFEKRDIEECFKFNKNEKLRFLGRKMEETENRISKIMDKRVHPKTKRKLESLFDRFQRESFNYYDKERGLVYESGFIDGINLMLLVMGKK